jgi:molecular chaperone IbpA
MTRVDFTPYRRHFVGFDRLFDALEKNAAAQTGDNYPPFNIERLDAHNFRITMAVAGFKAGDIDITAQQNQLVVKGARGEDEGDRSRFVHLGIANRGFERRFDLADFVKVTGADLADGLLTIELVREIPEALKPQKIAIGTQAAPDAHKGVMLDAVTLDNGANAAVSAEVDDRLDAKNAA